jgi:hypothetical protein
VPPAFERREHHEQVGRAVAFVFVILPRRLTFFHRHRNPRFLGQLLGGFVQTDQGTIGVVWPCVNGQHVLHGGYECAALFRRNDPLFLEMRLILILTKHSGLAMAGDAQELLFSHSRNPFSNFSVKFKGSLSTLVWSKKYFCMIVDIPEIEAKLRLL